MKPRINEDLHLISGRLSGRNATSKWPDKLCKPMRIKSGRCLKGFKRFTNQSGRSHEYAAGSNPKKKKIETFKFK